MIKQVTANIRKLAIEHGFTDCGIAPARKLESDTIRLQQYLSQGLHADMKFMENHFDKRTDPSLLVPGAKSVIVVLLNYFPEEEQGADDNFIISKYAYGRDYHKVMKKKLRAFQKSVSEALLPVSGRTFVDSMPVLERALAALAGLGWIGKNSMLISPKSGSFFFIGGIITDAELDYTTSPVHDFCGSCTRCLDACPTQAITDNRTVDSNRCISYWTIENKGSAIEDSFSGKFRDRIFGCDICQDVCPWNRKSTRHNTGEFNPLPDLMAMKREDWIDLTEERYNELFEGSAVKRARYEGLMRNIRFLT